ncbi:ABC transporter substrate-binding protein [Nitriliruptor alkaliphilus]|uniref:ABC transporter substrate-binding protein n=1 Tax=Nitriliruptor alkaliphilus TaxID=427918 RepID=UPI000696B188|nr:extracellular solute-binding protein [Nitriliruptor alkaliphilus]
MSASHHGGTASPPRTLRVLALALVAVLLFACGAPSGTPVAGDDAADDGGAEGSTTTDGGEGRLVVWDWKSSDAKAAAYFEAARADFAAKHPNVEVVFESQPFDQYYTLVGTAMQSGSGPDVILFNGGAQLRGRTDSLIPLDDHLGDLRDRLTGWDAFMDGDTTYAVPLTLQGFPIYYNKALYAEAGLDPESPPTTWEDLEAACEAIESSTDADCFALGNQEGIGIEFFLSGYAPGIFSPELYAAWLDGDRDWQSEEVRTVFELWTETNEDGWYNDGVNSTAMFMDMFTIFSGGNAAHVIGLISDVGHWADLGEFLEDDLGVMRPPTILAGAGDPFVPLEGGIGYAVAEWTEDPALAADLVASLASTAALAAFWEDAGAIAADTTIDTSDAGSGVVTDLIAWLPEGEPLLHTALSAETIELMHRLSQQLISGDVTVDEVLDQLEASDTP